MYALIEAEEGGLFRSDDGGRAWTRINDSRGLQQRAWYYTTLTVDPTDADVVWFPQVSMLRTEDGGRTVRSVEGGGWDYHDVWIDPADPRRMVVGSDAGVSVSNDGGESFLRAALPIGQAYHVATDTREPYRVLSTLQDFGTLSGPSDSLHYGGVLLSDWHDVGGGEAGHIVADPVDPDIVWAGEYLGIVTRFDERTGQARSVSAYPWNGSGHPASDLDYRFQWTAPIVVSPHDHRVVYHAANVLFRTEDGGRTWKAISPDLTRDDESKQQWEGGPITGDLTGVETYCTIFAVAESPLEPGLLWAGTDDGRVWLTRDGGGEWTEVTARLRGLPEWGTVSAIEPSRWDAGTAYVVVDAHRLDDMRPYLWKTTDYGATWTSLTGGLPRDVYLHVVREDTRKRGLLFLGSERGVSYSRDDGASWSSLKLNLPTVAVADLQVHGDDLVVGTTGRSLWILDDLTPVREMSEEIRAEAVHLFQPPPTIRWRRRSVAGSRAGAGSNPPQGVQVTYWLAESREEGVEATLEVLADDGTVVRTLRSVAEPQPIGPEHPDWSPGSEATPALSLDAGLHRAVWDFAWDAAGFIPDAMIDWGDPTEGPWAVPGEYTLRLTVGDRTATTTARLEPDPRVELSPEDYREQLEFTLGLRSDLREVIGMVRRLRVVREQVVRRNELLEGREGAADLVASGRALVETLDSIEGRLHNPQAEVTSDILAGRAGGAQLYSQLAPLYSASLESDGPPTEGMREVAAGYRERLARLRDELDRALTVDLAELEAQARALDLGSVLLPSGR
ncbi:MAG: glycosyl hydrolase [Thermoanaerobaculia bacterium]